MRIRLPRPLPLLARWLAPVLGSAAALVLVAACQVAPRAGTGECDDPELDPGAPMDLACLGDSLESLREEFNANLDKPRLITLLSPTCSPCELGSQAVRQSVLEAYPDADLKALVVWVDVQPESGLDQARARSVALSDPRVKQYHDPRQRAGRAFAERLLPTTLAWDVYLFYPPGVRWEERPPHPVYWSHQRGRIETRHFHPRERLFDELHRAMGELAGTPLQERATVALATETSP